MVTSPGNLCSNSSLALPTHGDQFSESTTSDFIVQYKLSMQVTTVMALMGTSQYK